MDAREIKLRQCYRMDNGQIIRVLSVRDTMVRFDIYDQPNNRWVQSYHAMPALMVKEPFPCPSDSVETLAQEPTTIDIDQRASDEARGVAD